MTVDLFDKVWQITENPEHFVRIFLPNLRGLSYFAEKSISESNFEEVPVWEFMKLVPESKLSAMISEINNLNCYLLSKEIKDAGQQFSGTIKDYLFITNHISLLKHLFGSVASIVSKLFSTKEREESLDTHIISIRDRMKNIFLSSNDKRYEKQIDDYTFIGYYAIGTCLLFRLAEMLHCLWSQKDIIRLSLIICCARMEYELRNMHQSQWQPMLVNLLAQNGGRFFRLCSVDFDGKEMPLYKVVSNSITLNRAVTPDWHETLLEDMQRNESSNIGLNRLFIFYIADLCITSSLITQKSYIESIRLFSPFPNLHTLKRYFNLFLQPDLYNSNVDITSWQPPVIIKDYLCFDKMSYEEKEQALREEYFPRDVYDLNALLYYTAEFYNEKILMDFECGNISNLNELDNKGIWFLSEWLIKERHYDFLQNMDVSAVASMLAGAVIQKSTKIIQVSREYLRTKHFEKEF